MKKQTHGNYSRLDSIGEATMVGYMEMALSTIDLYIFVVAYLLDDFDE